MANKHFFLGLIIIYHNTVLVIDESLDRLPTLLINQGYPSFEYVFTQTLTLFAITTAFVSDQVHKASFYNS